MNKIEIIEPFSAYNPYRALIEEESDPLFACISTKFPWENEPATPPTPLADRVVNWGKALLFNDYEKQVDFVGFAARMLDWGVFAVVGGMEGMIIAHELFHITILGNHPFSELPGIVKLVTIPAAIFSFIMGVIQFILEILHLQRAAELLYNVENCNEDPKIKLEWIKKRYFTIESQESEKIYNFIEKKLPSLDNYAKADYYDQIAQKALAVKFESLKRRITPGLAEEVHTQLTSIMSDLNSYRSGVRAEAAERAELLMESITKQAKVRVVVHIIGIIAVALTLISMGILFAGIGTTVIFVTLGVISSALMMLQFAVHKGYVDRGAIHFYDSLKELELKTFNNKRTIDSLPRCC